MPKFNRVSYAFSLLELLTALLVLAILLAVGVPQYKSYVARGKLYNVEQILHSYIALAQKGYLDDASFPASVDGGFGSLVSGGGFTAVTGSDYISQMRYVAVDPSWTNKAVMIQAIVSDEIGNSIDGYSAGESGQHNRITMAFKVDGELIKVYCGNWAGDTTDIPADYLPGGCDSIDFETEVTGV